MGKFRRTIQIVFAVFLLKRAKNIFHKNQNKKFSNLSVNNPLSKIFQKR